MTDNIETTEEFDYKAAFETQTAELDDMRTQFASIKAHSAKLLDETKQAKDKAKLEHESAKLAEKEKLAKAGDFEQLLKSSEAERNSLSEQLQGLQGKVSSEKINNTALKMAAELADGVNAEILGDYIAKRIKYTDDGVKVLDSNGDLTVSSLNDLKADFANNDRYKSLLRGNQASGGGATGNTSGSAAKSEITREDYNAMDPMKQSAFIRSGNKVV